MFRIAFDPALPAIATSTFPDGTVAAGEVFDWRAKGLQPIDALAMFRSGLLTHPPPSVAPAALPAATAQATEGGLVPLAKAFAPVIATMQAELTDAELERLTAPSQTVAFTASPDEPVTVEPPKPLPPSQPVSRRPNRSGR